MSNHDQHSNDSDSDGSNNRSEARSSRSGSNSSSSDLECPLCVCVYVYPVRTPCKHLFCRPCISNAMNYKASCPMCRADLSGYEPVLAPIDKEIEATLARTRNAEVTERISELEEEARQKARLIHRRICIGNRYDYLEPKDRSAIMSRNAHRWTMFVVPEAIGGEEEEGDGDFDITQYIDHVEYGLHPSFRPSTIRRREPPYELVRTGWGTFDVDVTIHWKPELQKDPLVFVHELEFEEGGSSAVYNITIDPDHVLAHRARNLRVM